MAYVFRFPTEITEIIYSMRDWKYERVKWRRGTPGEIALSPYKIMNHTIEHVPKQLFPSTYWITVSARFGGYLIDGLYDNKFDKVIAHDWTNGICKNNHHFAKMHGKHKLPCEPHDCRGWPGSFEPDEEDYDSDSSSSDF